LQAVLVPKRRLKRIQFSGWAGEVFNGLDFVSIRLNRKHDAGARRLAVEQDRTGAAYPVLASHVRTRQTEILPDKVAEQKPRLHLPPASEAVDDDIDADFGDHRDEGG
jgi:hypothetical protein